MLFIQQNELRPDIIDAIQTFKTDVVVKGVFIPDEILEFVRLLLVPDNIPEPIRMNLPEDIPNYTVKPAANITQFRGGFYEDKISSDVLYLSQYPIGNRGYIMNNLTGVIPNLSVNFKIVGDIKIPCPEYLGSVSLNDSIQMAKSTKILLDYDMDFLYNAAIMKTFVLSNVDNPYFPHFSNDLELGDMIAHFLSEDRLRKKHTKKAYKEIIEKDTYLHRLADLGEKMGVEKLTEESETTLKRLRE